MSVEIIESIPSAEDYVILRERAGLSSKSVEAAKVGLPNSLYAVTVYDTGNLIGMGRVIGDGACFFEIVDLAVDPDYQGHGLGKQIMLKMESYLQTTAMEGSYVSMVADRPEFYKKFGYKLTAPEAQGMYKRLKPGTLMTGGCSRQHSFR
jgi:ribosomal protein S18 acetylase RimI-like enzyme